MKRIGLPIFLMFVALGLTSCSTIEKFTNEPKQEAAAAPQTISPTGEVVGTPEVQEVPKLAQTSDSNIGGTIIGGAVEQAMDETDKSKMMHAMDKAPGKSTHWTNVNTQIEYTVTPTKKVRIQDKNYCRQYQMVAVYPSEREKSVEGVACIASDGNWHTLET